MQANRIAASGQFAPAPLPNPGTRFGKLTFVREVARHGRLRFAECRCDCGTLRETNLCNLLAGKTQSCGCRTKKHGKWLSPEYHAWCYMRTRCLSPGYRHYPNYGGRGITICAEWEDFEAFLRDMGPRPSDKHSVERLDVNGNYEKSNCVWATQQEQLNNTRRSRFIEYDGQRLTCGQWAKKVGMKGNVIRGRLDRGWSPERILTEPARTYPRKQPVIDCC